MSWAEYSDRFIDRILRPRAVGRFNENQSGMFLAVGREGMIEISFLVDPMDGVIADAKFQAFGETVLIAAADIACELVLRKTYLQAGRLSADLIEQRLKFPPRAGGQINQVLSAIEKASLLCAHIPLTEQYIESPIEMEIGKGEAYPDWDSLSHSQRIGVIQGVIARDIQPYVEMDAGGVEVKELEGTKLIIAYSGTCTTCYSSIGSTLQAIGQILRQKIHPELEVTPDPSFLSALGSPSDLY